MSASASLDIDEVSREYYADLVWFPVTAPFQAVDDSTVGKALDWNRLRPMSLATWKAMEIMRMQILDEASVQTEEEEQRDMLRYLWLHSAPIPTINLALWTGDWSIIGQGTDLQSDLLSLFRRFRARQILAHRAVIVRILPKDKSGHDKTPQDVCGPGGLSAIMGLLLSETRMSSHQLLWETWLPQALALHHRAMYWHGAWTVRGGSKVNADEFTEGDCTPMEMRHGFDLRGEDDPLTSDHESGQ